MPSIKNLINVGRGFRVRKRVRSIIQVYELLRMLSKWQFYLWLRRDDRKTLVRERSAFITLLFNVETVFAR